ncbi:MAG: hypothetical protein ACYDGW_11030 [Vulcanimicrobiaceae bacterium]
MQFQEVFATYSVQAGGQIVSADVYAGTQLSVLPDRLEAFIVPSGAVVTVPDAPFYVLEIAQGFVIRLDRETHNPRNVYFANRDGQIVWQVGENPWSCGLSFQTFRIDEQGRLIGVPDGRALIAFEIDIANGRIARRVDPILPERLTQSVDKALQTYAEQELHRTPLTMTRTLLGIGFVLAGWVIGNDHGVALLQSLGWFAVPGQQMKEQRWKVLAFGDESIARVMELERYGVPRALNRGFGAPNDVAASLEDRWWNTVAPDEDRGAISPGSAGSPASEG